MRIWKLEKLKAEHQEAVDGEQRWEKKIEDGRERIPGKKRLF